MICRLAADGLIPFSTEPSLGGIKAKKIQFGGGRGNGLPVSHNKISAPPSLCLIHQLIG